MNRVECDRATKVCEMLGDEIDEQGPGRETTAAAVAGDQYFG